MTLRVNLTVLVGLLVGGCDGCASRDLAAGPPTQGTAEAAVTATAGESATATASTGESPYGPEVAKAEALGRMLFAHDLLAWWGTDALAAEAGAPHIRGWVTIRNADGGTVHWVSDHGKGLVVGARVLCAQMAQSACQLERLAQPEPLAGELRARFSARQTAQKSREFKPLSERYNAAVLSGQAFGFGDRWLVYLLAASTEPGVMLLGGHYRVEVSADGKQVLKTRALSKSIIKLPLQPDLPPDAKVAAAMVSHAVDPHPIESHVFASLSYGRPLMVVAGSASWSVEKGRIAFLGKIAE